MHLRTRIHNRKLAEMSLISSCHNSKIMCQSASSATSLNERLRLRRSKLHAATVNTANTGLPEPFHQPRSADVDVK